MNNALNWRRRITVSDATQRRIWENLRDLREVSVETSLINFPGNISQICKSAPFEMPLRCCTRRLRCIHAGWEFGGCSLLYVQAQAGLLLMDMERSWQFQDWSLIFVELWRIIRYIVFVHCVRNIAPFILGHIKSWKLTGSVSYQS